jgi:hypothetical protein
MKRGDATAHWASRQARVRRRCVVPADGPGIYAQMCDFAEPEERPMVPHEPDHAPPRVLVPQEPDFEAYIRLKEAADVTGLRDEVKRWPMLDIRQSEMCPPPPRPVQQPRPILAFDPADILVHSSWI